MGFLFLGTCDSGLPLEKGSVRKGAHIVNLEHPTAKAKHGFNLFVSDRGPMQLITSAIPTPLALKLTVGQKGKRYDVILILHSLPTVATILNLKVVHYAQLAMPMMRKLPKPDAHKRLTKQQQIGRSSVVKEGP